MFSLNTFVNTLESLDNVQPGIGSISLLDVIVTVTSKLVLLPSLDVLTTIPAGISKSKLAI